jgi:chloramphenicol 3-O-phosphotransferase
VNASDSRRAVEGLLREIVDRCDDPGRSWALTPDSVRALKIVNALQDVAEAHPTVDWVAANGRRVDASARAPGREWRIVMSSDEDGVHSATVLEKPEPFPGVPGGRALIVNGPSSVGKSSVLRTMLDVAAAPWVMFDEPTFGEVRPLFLIWSDSAPTLRPGFLKGIEALAGAGNQVGLAAGGFPSEFFDGLRRAVPTLALGLDCPLEVRLERQAKRPDRWGGLTEASETVHEGWDYALRFDTSTTTAGEIATAVLALVAARPDQAPR